MLERTERTLRIVILIQRAGVWNEAETVLGEQQQTLTLSRLLSGHFVVWTMFMFQLCADLIVRVAL